MANWIHTTPTAYTRQPHLDRFLRDRQRRVCLTCGWDFRALPPKAPTCPQCGSQEVRRRFTIMSMIVGRRFGKTYGASIGALEEAVFPGTTGWACAPTIPKLNRYVIPAFQRLIPNEAVKHWDSQLQDLWLKNGSLIHFQTLETPDQGRGQELDWLWIDEVCELTEAHWNTIEPSLIGDTVAMFTSTPRGYDWVYDRLYLPAEQRKPGFWACQAKTSDSANPRMSLKWLAGKRQEMGDAWFEQEYEANFVNFQGAIYENRVPAQILRSDDDVRKWIPEWNDDGYVHPWRTAYIGVDTGADHPFGLAKAICTDKAIIWVDEYLERDRSFAEHAVAMKRMAFPHQAQFAINQNERQPILEFARHGIDCAPAVNDVHAGIERVKSWIGLRKMWFVQSRVPRLIKQMQSLRYADERTDQQSRKKLVVYKKNDELPDCVRYACMTYPELPNDPVEAALADLSQFTEAEQRDIQRLQKHVEAKGADRPSADSYWHRGDDLVDAELGRMIGNYSLEELLTYGEDDLY